ncbi:MAG: heat-inducible transcriptional repressor HrcA [Gammaproteobacteria bacterium]|nr:heat-inducible transcriptional repressor HrcA [Gammaproteobacteria bacterium]
MTDQHGNPPSDRSAQILRALVAQYIRDGQPVGSRTLARASGLNLSAATIRNVMADLEEYGFVAAPHTSAGRVPTAKGYRFFVDTLVKLQPLPATELSRLQNRIGSEAAGDAKTLAEAASVALSSLTQMAGVVTLPRARSVTLRQVEFLSLSNQRVLAILVVNDHEVQNRVLAVDRQYSESELRRAANFLNERFVGHDIREVRDRIIEELRETSETMNRLMIDAIAVAERALDLGQERSEMIVSGETQLMGFQELSDIEKLRQLFDAFSTQREILHLLDRSIAADGVQIFIGEESGYRILDDCSIVTAPYKVGEEIVGVLGVIGPTRMAYERVIPIVDITARLVGAALNSGQ